MRIEYTVEDSGRILWGDGDEEEASGLLGYLRKRYQKSEVYVNNEKIQKVSKSFRNDITVDTIHDPRSCRSYLIPMNKNFLDNRLLEIMKLKEKKIPEKFYPFFGKFNIISYNDKQYEVFHTKAMPSGNNINDLCDEGYYVKYIDIKDAGLTGLIFLEDPDRGNKEECKGYVEKKTEKYNKVACEWCNEQICSNGAAKFSHLKKHLRDLVDRGKITKKEMESVKSVKLNDKMLKIFNETYKN